jgi:hypothetical protein
MASLPDGGDLLVIDLLTLLGFPNARRTPARSDQDHEAPGRAPYDDPDNRESLRSN